jgi:hypothetical protein
MEEVFLGYIEETRTMSVRADAEDLEVLDEGYGYAHQ